MGLTVWHYCLILLAVCQLEKQTNGCVLLRSTIFQQLCKGCVLMTGGHLAQEGPPPAIEVAPAILSVQLGSPITYKRALKPKIIGE